MYHSDYDRRREPTEEIRREEREWGTTTGSEFVGTVTTATYTLTSSWFGGTVGTKENKGKKCRVRDRSGHSRRRLYMMWVVTTSDSQRSVEVQG